jgi:prophage DNA circulation protein
VSDEFSQDLLVATWGDLQLDVLNTDDSFGRDLVPFSYPNVDGATHRDMGARAWRTNLTLVFLAPNVIARAKAFVAQANEGVPYTFTHPVWGSFEARVEDGSISVTAEQRDFISMDISLVEEAATASFDVISTTTDKRANVDAAAAEVNSALSDAGLTSTVGDDAVAQADLWEADEDLTQRTINLEFNEIANSIASDIETLGLASDITYSPSYDAMMALQQAMREYAEFLIATAPQLTTYTLIVRMPLLMVCQSLYGGELALDRFFDALDLNALDDPGMIPAGTVLTVIAP